MFVLGIVIVLILGVLFALGLSSAAQRGDEVELVADAPPEEWPEFSAVLESFDAPRCRCGVKLEVRDWRHGSCAPCRPRLRIPRVRRGERAGFGRPR